VRSETNNGALHAAARTIRSNAGIYTEPMPTRRDLSIENLAEVASGCACIALRRTAHSLTRAYDEALRPSGLRITQFSLLVAAALAGPANLSQLAHVCGLDRTTLTRDLKPLAARGLVEVRVGEDRRARVVELTAAGRRAMAEALPRWRAAQATALGDQAAAFWPRLADDLARLSATAQRA
jgi:DNA-binding MarR family transcriptional regulator